MGKRNKNIEVEINEVAGSSKNTTELELLVRKKVIGKVYHQDEEAVTVEFKSGKKRKASSVDEGIQLIIEEYNLHDE